MVHVELCLQQVMKPENMEYIQQCLYLRQKKLCPQLIVVASDHDRYKSVSMQVYEIFCDFTDKIEPLSIDEAFLDVTDNINNMPLKRLH